MKEGREQKHKKSNKERLICVWCFIRCNSSSTALKGCEYVDGVKSVSGHYIILEKNYFFKKVVNIC